VTPTGVSNPMDIDVSGDGRVAVGTASGAAQRGYKVILPVDCSAGESIYNEQYAAFHLTKGGPVGVTSNVTATRSTMIKY